MYREASRRRTAGKDGSEVVVPTQLELFESLWEAGDLSLVLVGFGIDPC